MVEVGRALCEGRYVMHGKGGRSGRKATKHGSLDRFLAEVTSGWKLAALAVALIAMSVMGAFAMRRMLGGVESPMPGGRDATCIASPRVSG
jgi:hypothetical protein